jgi:hypothetical protein
MVCEEDVKVVRDVIDAFRSGEVDVTRDADRIAHAVSIVRANDSNPKLCSHVDVTMINPGDAVCFLYHRPDVNEAWRFGVVDKFNAGCWVIFTFNIKRRRQKKKGVEKIEKDGPSYRQYDTRHMGRIRLVCRPGGEGDTLGFPADLTKFGLDVMKLAEKLLTTK